MNLTLLNLESPKVSADTSTGTLSLTDMAAWEDVLMSVRSKSGQTVTPEKAKRCSAVLACMRGISEDLSALPKVLYKRGPNGDDPATDHEVYALLDSTPNDVMTSMEMWEHIIFDLMLHGNFFVLKNEDPSNPGGIESLWPLQAGYVTRQSQRLLWNYTDPLTGQGGDFTPDTVWRGTILSGNGLDGVAITLLAREAIGLLLAAEEQGARLFSHGIQSDLKLETEDHLEDTEKKDLRAAFMSRHAGSPNAWLPLLLEGGLKASRIGLTAQESQYLESREFQISDIARVFRYPEVLLGSSSKNKATTYASAEQFFQSYVKHTLTPWAVRLEQTAQRDLLSRKERVKYFLKHDFSSLLRGDTKARYEAYGIGIDKGFLSPHDARRSENLPFVPGLDFYSRPLNSEATAGKDKDKLSEPNENTGKDNEDESGDGLARRVAELIFKKEHKALIGRKQDAELFYTFLGSFVEDLTGGDVDSVLAYCEMRRTTADRFSKESKDKAIASLISLCKKDR